MRMPQPPDLRAPGRVALTALAAGAVVCAVLWIRLTPHLGPNLGDTDDAMRLVIVRDLLAGRGWFDQRITRLQPPEGVYLHWSRLLDGAIALWESGWRLLLPPARAEWMTRATWPFVWVLVAIGATLALARGLAGETWRVVRRTPLAAASVCAAAVICVIDLQLYWAQFQPGRIDHHDVQIALALVAAAGGLQARGRTGAVVAGLATGLGLAIGLEALVFEAAVAAAFGARLLFDRGEAGRAGAYGSALAGAAALAFLAQTPPARWGVPACDALGVNLLAGAVVGGLSLAGAAALGARRGWASRTVLLVAGAAATLAIYLALDPHCVRGPFADVDPRMKPFWLDHVQEMRPWPVLYRQDRPEALSVAVFGGLGAAAWLVIGLSRARRHAAAWLLSGALLALSLAAAWSAFRMDAYAMWFSVPPLAVLAAEVAERGPRRGGIVLLLAVSLLLSPAAATGAVLAAAGQAPWSHRVRKPGGAPEYCYSAGSYRPLAAQPPGLALSEIDLGPFVLAYTRSSALSAPYHRMNQGVMAARGVLTAPADAAGAAGAEARARALGVAYVLECRGHARHFDRDGLAADALQRRLDAGLPPPWLQPVTPTGAPLEVFRVGPPG